MKKLALLLLSLTLTAGMLTACINTLPESSSSETSPASESASESSSDSSSDSSVEEKKYVVTFKQDGQKDVTYEVKEGEALTSIPSPVAKTGYTFVWDTTDFSNVTADMTVTAIPTAKSYTISFDTEDEDMTVTFDGAYTLPTPTKTGYTFAGWKHGENSVSASGDKWNIDGENITLTATWTAKEYTVTLNPAGGALTGETSVKVTYNAAHNLPTPTKDGYTFGGWAEVVGCDVAILEGDTWLWAKDTTLTAQWTANTYTVTRDLDGGTGLEETKSVTFGRAYDLGAPMKEGYTFLHWVKEGTDEVFPTTGEWTTVGGASVKAVWKANEPDTFTITFKDGESVLANRTVVDGGSLAATDIPALPTKTGYTAAWSVTSFENVTANMDVTVNWTAKQYTLTFRMDAEDKTVTFDSEYELPEPTKTGYTFGGWYYGGDKVEQSGEKWNIDGDSTITLIAVWTANQYTVTLNANGGTLESNTVSVTYNDVPEIPQPTRTGYEFGGWFKDDVTFIIPSIWDIDGDVELEAQWTAKEYTVTLDLDGGTGIDTSKKVTYGASFDFGTPTKYGYTFDGWKRGENTFTLPEKWNIAEENVTLTAKWKAKEFKVNLNAGEGTVSQSTVDITYGEIYSLPTPTREGYEFKGWKCGETSVALGDGNTVWTYSEGTVTLTATWEKVTPPPASSDSAIWTPNY